MADYYNLPVAALRLSAVVLALLGAGWGVVLYVVLWIVMPYRDSPGTEFLPVPRTGTYTDGKYSRSNGVSLAHSPVRRSP
jgi:hypothetical protein